MIWRKGFSENIVPISQYMCERTVQYLPMSQMYQIRTADQVPGMMQNEYRKALSGISVEKL
jgi:hypothetical protein